MELKPSVFHDYNLSGVCQQLLDKEKLNDIANVRKIFNIPTSAKFKEQQMVITRLVTDQNFLVHMRQLNGTVGEPGVVLLVHFGSSTELKTTSGALVHVFPGQIPYRSFLRVFSAKPLILHHCTIMITIIYTEDGVEKREQKNLYYGKAFLSQLVAPKALAKPAAKTEPKTETKAEATKPAAKTESKAESKPPAKVDVVKPAAKVESKAEDVKPRSSALPSPVTPANPPKSTPPIVETVPEVPLMAAAAVALLEVDSKKRDDTSVDEIDSGDTAENILSNLGKI